MTHGSTATVEPADPTRRRPVARVPVAVATPAVAAFVLSCWGMGRPSMYGTEAVTYWAAHQSVPTLLHVLSHVDVVHGVYYAVMHVVFLFGGGTVALRLPSALAMAAAVALVAVLARRLTGSDRIAFFAGGWMCTLPLADGYAQQGRSYSLDLLATLVVGLLLLRALDPAATDDRRRWIAYGAAVAVAGYLHEMTTVALAAHAVTLWWARADREQFRRWMRAVLGAAVALAPLLVLSARQGGQLGWVAPPSVDTVRTLVQNLLGPASAVLLVNVALIVVAVTSGRRRATRRGEVTLVGFALPLLVLPPLLVLTESAVAQPLYGGPRYFLYCVAGAALLVAAGLDRLLLVLGRGRPVRVAGTAVLVGLLLAQWPLQQRLHSARGVPQDLLAQSVYLGHQSRSGDAVVYSPRSLAAGQLAYPRYYRSLTDVTRAVSPARSGTLYGTQRAPAAISRDLRAERRVWLVGRPVPRHPTRPELVAIERWFRPVLVHHVHGVTIVLYERTAAG